jgi:hypothetical protein
MRIYFCVMILAILSRQSIFAQDLIVTNVGDSISCAIKKETLKEVHFSYTRYNQHIFTKLGKDRVSAIVRGFYNTKGALNSSGTGVLSTGSTITLNQSALPANTGVIPKDSVRGAKWQTAISGGYGYRLFRSAVSATDYEKLYDQKRKPGISAGANAFYFPWKNVGFGVRYDFFNNRAERDIRTRDNVTIQFLGIGVAHRKAILSGSTSILSSFLLGYQPYKNTARYVGQDYVLKANTMGWALSVGVDQRIGKNIALGLAGNLLMGNVFKFHKSYKGRTETVNLSHHELEDLSRASLTLSLKFLQ